MGLTGGVVCVISSAFSVSYRLAKRGGGTDRNFSKHHCLGMCECWARITSVHLDPCAVEFVFYWMSKGIDYSKWDHFGDSDSEDEVPTGPRVTKLDSLSKVHLDKSGEVLIEPDTGPLLSASDWSGQGYGRMDGAGHIDVRPRCQAGTEFVHRGCTAGSQRAYSTGTAERYRARSPLHKALLQTADGVLRGSDGLLSLIFLLLPTPRPQPIECSSQEEEARRQGRRNSLDAIVDGGLGYTAPKSPRLSQMTAEDAKWAAFGHGRDENGFAPAPQRSPRKDPPQRSPCVDQISAEDVRRAASGHGREEGGLSLAPPRTEQTCTQRCAGCGEILGNERVTVGDVAYHPECCFCYVCGREIGAQPYKVSKGQARHAKCKSQKKKKKKKARPEAPGARPPTDDDDDEFEVEWCELENRAS